MNEDFVMQVVLEAINDLQSNDWHGALEYEILISALSILQIYKMEEDDEYVVKKEAALSAYSECLQAALICKSRQKRGENDAAK